MSLPHQRHRELEDDHPRATAPGLPTGILEGRTGCPSPVKQLQCWGALSQPLCSLAPLNLGLSTQVKMLSRQRSNLSPPARGTDGRRWAQRWGHQGAMSGSHLQVVHHLLSRMGTGIHHEALSFTHVFYRMIQKLV